MATTKYSNVYYSPTYRFKNKPYKAKITIDGIAFNQRYETERQAALAIDNLLITYNKSPINILKPKTCHH